MFNGSLISKHFIVAINISLLILGVVLLYLNFNYINEDAKEIPRIISLWCIFLGSVSFFIGAITMFNDDNNVTWDFIKVLFKCNIMFYILCLFGFAVYEIYMNFEIISKFIVIGFFGIIVAFSLNSKSKNSSGLTSDDSGSDCYAHPVTGEMCCTNADGSLTSQGITSYSWTTDGGESGDISHHASFTSDDGGSRTCTDDCCTSAPSDGS